PGGAGALFARALLGAGSLVRRGGGALLAFHGVAGLTRIERITRGAQSDCALAGARPPRLERVTRDAGAPLACALPGAGSLVRRRGGVLFARSFVGAGCLRLEQMPGEGGVLLGRVIVGVGGLVRVRRVSGDAGRGG